jgi:hypothetical protein
MGDFLPNSIGPYMSLMNLIKQLGEDFDLLTLSDEWLEEERKSVSSDLERCAKELKAIIIAQRAKKLLQDKNMVAVQSLVKSNDGNITDVLVNIMSLPEALELLSQADKDSLSDILIHAQIEGWNKDGHDFKNSFQLAHNKLSQKAKK